MDWSEELGFEEFFIRVLNRTEEFAERIVRSDDEEYRSSVLSHVDLLERTAILPVQISQVVSNEADLQVLEGLRAVFVQLLDSFLRHFGNSSSRITRISFIPHQIIPSEGAGRPSVNIPFELLEDLRGVGFAWEQIAKMFRVSRWTVMRRVQSYGLQGLSRFSSITDEQIDGIIHAYIGNHGSTTGESYMRGHFRALGYYVPRRRVRAGINRVDPRNTALRWGALVSRRVYSVPWPNSLWHLDGHHSLIRWGLVIHGCIDGYSRRIIYLVCSSNNLAETVLHLFETAIERDDGLWPWQESE
ncbi:cytosolic Fe-s cluster assembly factor nubp1-b-like [Paramuricea clavata]|uniref:Cytosolic Fe-s cluster assembly factor nubp1-b-like n=1 Tax=Paramuricea clavata TaxID=317549 RepID=A0A7D9ILP3_PARCT|nr:cytosolic Fe-s cluster assembly factor nubp1-b-like [Paramuricea clavata]